MGRAVSFASRTPAAHAGGPYTAVMATGNERTRVIPANDYRRERWKNQLGWTREIARSPQSGDWDWRLSIAEIEQDTAFSHFEGVERELVLLSGNGLRLRFDDGEQVDLMPPHGRLRFAGERAATGELIDGPTQDFNLMWRRDAVDAQLWHRPLVGPMVVFVEPGSVWALHLLAGQARFADASGLPALAAADTALLLGSGDGRQRFVLDGGGEVLVIRLSPAS
jgi:environmental stress-induced protein Ves